MHVRLQVHPDAPVCVARATPSGATVASVLLTWKRVPRLTHASAVHGRSDVDSPQDSRPNLAGTPLGFVV
jgi:hypothetical protein